MHFHIISIFPNMFDSYLSESILKRAIKDKKIKISFYNPILFLDKKDGKFYNKIDDKPFGGGPGMVLKAEPFLKAIKKAVGQKKHFKIYYLSPRGKVFNTQMAQKIAENSQKKKGKIKDIIFVSGRYEGIDSRVSEIYKGEFVSVGDFVLTGGELPIMIMIDSISRQIEGVLGNKNSLEEQRLSAGKYYTRPEDLKWKKKIYKVPKVLLSGNHKEIEKWREKNK
ncbi:tRNA (guanosine(37)-N1)-methyltransferase TrmD [Candidatus Campbellbacteria bacterium]|nr:MAG: tRNA (guanosine(37)-N1)-methyltransferase TrmD [Candidatus Campbellbacteria bacterium]